jgi:hypothetical protein
MAEILTGATSIYGINIPPHGNHEGLEKCAATNPPSGTFYFSTTNAAGSSVPGLYIWLREAKGPDEDYGWILLFRPGLEPFVGIRSDETLLGEGLATDVLSVRHLLEYTASPTRPYSEGDMVYGDIQFGSNYAKGVFRRVGAGWHPVALDTPVGSMIQFIWTRDDQQNDPPLPPGYRRCDHGLYDKTVYADLYAVIGDRFEEGGDPSDRFRVPDIDNTIIYCGILA